jgi:hypothetical protein
MLHAHDAICTIGLFNLPSLKYVFLYPPGYAGAQHFTHTGGSAEYICMSDEPEYAAKTAAGEGTAWLYGVELEVSGSNFFSTENSDPHALHNTDVQCAVCRNRVRSSKVCILFS